MGKKPKARVKYNWLPILGLSLVISYALAIRLWHIQASPYPLALDPYFHMADSAEILATGKVVPWAGYDITRYPSYYPRGLAILGAVAAKAGISLIDFYRYFSLVTVVGIGLAFYWLLRAFFRPWAAVLGTAGYLFLPYVTHRTILTLPENLNLVWLIMILALIARLPDFKKRRSQWWGLVGIGLLFGLSFFTHPTFLVGVGFILTYALAVLASQRRWEWFLAFLIILLWLAPFALKDLPASWGLTLPTKALLSQHFGLWLAILAGGGLLGFLISHRRDQWRGPFVAALIVLTTFFWLFYQGESLSLASIEVERWLLYVGWLIPFGIGWLVEWLADWQVIWLARPLILILAVGLLMPRWSRPWPEVFSPKEVEAAEYIKNDLPYFGLYLSQPILEWLLKGVSQRLVIWDAYEDSSARIRDKSIAQLAAETEVFHANPTYIVFSRLQNDPDSLTRLSDRTIAPVDFSVSLETPNISETKFACLPVVFDNDAVVIYQLLPLPEDCLNS